MREFRDEGVSGTIHLSERPAGAQLIAWADAQNFDVVVLTSSDRIGRHTLVIELAKDYLKKRVKIEYVYKTYEDSPEGELHEGVSGLFSQYEHSKIKLRLQGGLRKKVREHGGYVASQRPYGYVKTADGNLTEHPEEGPIVKQIFKLCDEGQPSYAIARQLNAQKTPKPESTTKSHKRNHDGWLHRTVRGFLQSPRYIGEATYGAGQIPIPCPPLVDKDLFERVKVSLPTKKANSKRNTKHQYLLQKLLYCGECGKPYYSFSNREKRGYCCSVMRSRGKEAGHDGIRWRYDADYLEGAVLDFVCRTVWPVDPDQAFVGLDFEVAEDPASGVSETALASLDAELLNIDRKRLQTIDYATENAIDGADLKASLAILTTRKEETELALTRERKTLADSVDVAKTATSWIAWLKAHADPDRRVSWTEDEFRESGLEVQRAFTKAMIDRITIEDDGGRGRLRIEGHSSKSVPLYMNTPLPDYTITSGERVVYEPSKSASEGLHRTPRSRTQPMKR